MKTEGIFRGGVAAGAGSEAVEAFRADFGRAFLRLEIDPLGGHPLECGIAMRAMPHLALATGYCSPIRGYHPASLSDNDDFVLVAVTTGGHHLQWAGGEVAFGAGEAVLTRADETNIFVGRDPTQIVNIKFERKLLAPLLDDADAAAARPIPANAAALQLLLGYAHTLTDVRFAADPDTLAATSHHLYDLMALALGRAREPGAHAGGIRAARLAAVKADMRQHFRQPLTIGDVARRHGISASYLRQLFAEAGTSFADQLLNYRLAAAYRALHDVRRAHHGISAIAYDCGFGDLSYFNRTFRRRYGMTPSQAREAAGRW